MSLQEICLQSATQFANIVIVVILGLGVPFNAVGKMEGRPNNNSWRVYPVAECSVVLYT